MDTGDRGGFVRPRPVVGKATVPDAVRRLLDKFEYPDRESPTQVVPILPTLGGGAGTGAYIHLTRNATQSIASGGELISWDTLGLQGVSGFSQSVPTTTVTITQAGYYNIAVQLGWSSFDEGGTVTILKNGVSVWPPADDPGLWSTTDGQFFEGTAPAIDCKTSDVLTVNLNPDDASAQDLASGTLAVYLVDRAVNESFYRELVMAHGPVAYWRLDETSGGTAADETGTFDATYTNAPDLGQTGVMQDGSGSLSINLDGNKHVLGADSAALEFTGSAPFTLEAWFITDTVAGNAIIIQKQENGKVDGWELGRASSVLFFSREGGGVLSEIVTGNVVFVGTTHYVVGTYDGTTLSLYLDGALIATDATVVSMDANAVTLSIGRDSVTGAANLDGRIDEVAIYDRALTPAEILEHWTVGGGI